MFRVSLRLGKSAMWSNMRGRLQQSPAPCRSGKLSPSKPLTSFEHHGVGKMPPLGQYSPRVWPCMDGTTAELKPWSALKAERTELFTAKNWRDSQTLRHARQSLSRATRGASKWEKKRPNAKHTNKADADCKVGSERNLASVGWRRIGQRAPWRHNMEVDLPNVLQAAVIP